MKIISRTTEDGWSIFQRVYATRDNYELALTQIIVKWADETKNKSLDGLAKVLDDFHKEYRHTSASRIITTRNCRGRYLSKPYEREFEIRLMKPRRFPFIQIGEPFAPATRNP